MNLLNDLILLPGLVLSYHSLVKQLKELHPGRYEEVKIPMRFFFLSETIPITLISVADVIKILMMVIPRNMTDYFDGFSEVLKEILWYIYPLLQAYGMLRLKDSKDPIGGISALRGILIFS